MSNLALIQPQRVDFDTQQTCDWLDGLPMIGTPGLGGAVAGAANVGTGLIAVGSVVAGTLVGAHTVSVTGITGGITSVSVTDPRGIVTGQGVVGAPIYAAGITLALTPGATAFAVGDSFAVAVVPVAVDITGLQFDLDARDTVDAASIALQATSGGSSPTIVSGGATGLIAMTVPQLAMAQLPAKADGYPYAILATDPSTGRRVPAFYGLIHHTAVAAQIGQGA
ncbi:hypothetical protein ACN9MF_11260 [Methylobacterium fujisawaense]|uniref:hypothetical protein n=1 Tax=Methylobacterium fujisawaense TaxID=107400 RepID=UPI003CEA26E1